MDEIQSQIGEGKVELEGLVINEEVGNLPWAGGKADDIGD